MVSAAIIGAIQIQVNRRECRDADFDIDGEQDDREQQGRGSVSSGADGALRTGFGAVLSVGMSNNLTDILVQQFRKSFELSRFSAQLVSTANFTGYFCMAIPAALVMRRWATRWAW